MNKQHRLTQWLEFAPLIMFFAAYKYKGILAATVVLIVATIISSAISYHLNKKLSYMAIFTLILVTVFGALTVYFNNESFIKMKPTAINLIFASLLFFGLVFKKNFIKVLLSSALKMQDRGWDIVAKMWAVYFVFSAVLNEIIWRNFSTDFWVAYKTFGGFIITLPFVALQLFVIRGYIITENK